MRFHIAIFLLFSIHHGVVTSKMLDLLVLKFITEYIYEETHLN